MPRRRTTLHLHQAIHESNTLVDPASFHLSIPGPDATAEELLAHADMLSSQMAMQGYYLPILGGVQELFRGVAATANNGVAGASSAFESTLANSAYALGLAGALTPNGPNTPSNGDLLEAEDENSGDGSYIDHLQQPGNTKKRKVPTAASSRAHAHSHRGLDGSGDEEDSPLSEGRERITGHGGADLSGGDTFEGAGIDAESTSGGASSSGASGAFRSPSGRMSKITLAGLKHKETLKVRKRQLATVLGALSHGDTLALDQALSANYPFAATAAAAASSSSGSGGGSGDLKASDVPKIRLSKRNVARLARLSKLAAKYRHPDKAGLECTDFTFDCPSASE